MLRRDVVTSASAFQRTFWNVSALARWFGGAIVISHTCHTGQGAATRDTHQLLPVCICESTHTQTHTLTHTCTHRHTHSHTHTHTHTHTHAHRHIHLRTCTHRQRETHILITEPSSGVRH